MSDTRITTGVVRLSYAHIFHPLPETADIDAGKYTVTLLIPKTDTATVGRIREAIAAAEEAGVSSKWNGKRPKALRSCLRDGDTDKADEHPEYKGMYFISAKSNQAPLVIDRNKNDILDETEIYSGCWARASVNFFPYSASGSNGVGCGLRAVQKWKDGEPLGGSRASADEFDDAGESDDDMLG